jgi:hypothetical protein
MKQIGFQNINKKRKYEDALIKRNISEIKHIPKIYREVYTPKI